MGPLYGKDWRLTSRGCVGVGRGPQISFQFVLAVSGGIQPVLGNAGLNSLNGPDVLREPREPRLPLLRMGARAKSIVILDISAFVEKERQRGGEFSY